MGWNQTEYPCKLTFHLLVLQHKPVISLQQLLVVKKRPSRKIMHGQNKATISNISSRESISIQSKGEIFQSQLSHKINLLLFKKYWLVNRDP